MKLAHLSDLHVGYRAYDRAAPNGMNQREADVAAALHAALDGVIAAQPDLVLFAGDVFHSVRPPNSAILTLFSELGRLRAALPAAHILMVAGNHDTPRSSDAGTILPLYRALGIEVATHELVRWTIAPGVVVTGVPSAVARAVPEPFEGAHTNVLLMHGDVAGFGSPADAALQPEQFAHTDWDYVALGHYHVAAAVGPRAWYSGAIEYTSSDPWSELAAEARRGYPGKGWTLVELTPSGLETTFQAIPTRRFVVMPRLEAAGLGTEELDAAIAARLEAAQIDGAVARLVVDNVTREMQRTLDHAALRAWKGRALQLTLQFNRPAEVDPEPRVRRIQRLEQMLVASIAGRELSPDVDRDALQKLGLQYLADT